MNQSNHNPILAKISGVGKYLPEKVLSNQDLEKLVDTNDEWIVSRTGISERRIVADGEATSHMSINAINELLETTDTDVSEIDVIIVATVTPDRFFPSTACIVQERIGAKNCWGFDLSAACSGFVFGLNTASRFIESGAYKKVIVVGVDAMSTIMNYKDRDTCILFGDGAGAVLVEPSEEEGFGIIDSMSLIDGSGGDHLYMPAGGSEKPATHETIDADEHYLHQDGKIVYINAVKGMADISAKILERNGLNGEDIDVFIPHQANKRIIDSTAKRLNIDPAKVIINIGKYGNTTAGTIPLGIYDAVKDGKLKKGDVTVLAAFGAGYTLGSTLIKWSY
ncbi:ketoacyl-ACP synthase III [Candidatus Marinimicrobia bacterium MT.SAG.4]|nr:ketoacyl-ACP synthase III [Candidatus Marinimicrobia bacterium MT.SAG.4]